MTLAMNDKADEISVWADKLLKDGYVTIPNVADVTLPLGFAKCGVFVRL